jgi:hypothetical protein
MFNTKSWKIIKQLSGVLFNLGMLGLILWMMYFTASTTIWPITAFMGCIGLICAGMGAGLFIKDLIKEWNKPIPMGSKGYDPDNYVAEWNKMQGTLVSEVLVSKADYKRLIRKHKLPISVHDCLDDTSIPIGTVRLKYIIMHNGIFKYLLYMYRFRKFEKDLRDNTLVGIVVEVVVY